MRTNLRVIYDADLKEPDNALFSFLRGKKSILVLRPGLDTLEALDLVISFTELEKKEGRKWPDELQIVQASDCHELVYFYPEKETQIQRIGAGAYQFMTGRDFSLN